jgi:hypothetical protein
VDELAERAIAVSELMGDLLLGPPVDEDSAEGLVAAVVGPVGLGEEVAAGGIVHRHAPDVSFFLGEMGMAAQFIGEPGPAREGSPEPGEPPKTRGTRGAGDAMDERDGAPRGWGIPREKLTKRTRLNGNGWETMSTPVSRGNPR